MRRSVERKGSSKMDEPPIAMPWKRLSRRRMIPHCSAQSGDTAEPGSQEAF